MKEYCNPQVEMLMFGQEDILTGSSGDEHGMEVPSVTDDDWQLGE